MAALDGKDGEDGDIMGFFGAGDVVLLMSVGLDEVLTFGDDGLLAGERDFVGGIDFAEEVERRGGESYALGSLSRSDRRVREGEEGGEGDE